MSPEPVDPLLRVSALTKSFPYGRSSVQAVTDVSFTVARGELVAVMGPSGCGKSTLLHLIAGLTDPDDGAISIDGLDMLGLSESRRTLFRRQHIGLVFQAANLIPDLSGRENIVLPAMLGGTALKAGEPEALIAALGIEDASGRLPDAMSGGEQQRVAIARALVTGPALLLADEPTGNLDTGNSHSLCALLTSTCRENGSTVLMVTHNPAVAHFADRILIMRDGALIEELPKERFGTVGELGQHYLDQLRVREAEGQPA